VAGLDPAIQYEATCRFQVGPFATEVGKRAIHE